MPYDITIKRKDTGEYYTEPPEYQARQGQTISVGKDPSTLPITRVFVEPGIFNDAQDGLEHLIDLTSGDGSSQTVRSDAASGPYRINDGQPGVSRDDLGTLLGSIKVNPRQ